MFSQQCYSSSSYLYKNDFPLLSFSPSYTGKRNEWLQMQLGLKDGFPKAGLDYPFSKWRVERAWVRATMHRPIYLKE